MEKTTKSVDPQLTMFSFLNKSTAEACKLTARQPERDATTFAVRVDTQGAYARS